jgi:hypothetical protein
LNRQAREQTKNVLLVNFASESVWCKFGEFRQAIVELEIGDTGNEPGNNNSSHRPAAQILRARPRVGTTQQ